MFHIFHTYSEIKRSKSHIPLCQTYKLQVLIYHEIQNFDVVIVASMQLHPHFEQVNDSFNMHSDECLDKYQVERYREY